MISRPLVLVCLIALGACSASAPPEPALAATPTRSLGLAFQPGPCVAGANVVLASAFEHGPPQPLRYLEPTDGDLKFALLVDRRPSLVAFRWLAVPDATNGARLPGPPWNLELSFNSSAAGACPIHVEFSPSLQALSTGLGKAETTVLLKDAPPPPPLARQPVMPGSE